MDSFFSQDHIGSSSMRVCCIQSVQSWNNSEGMFSLAREALSHAVANEAELVVFCEQYATGWNVDVACLSNAEDVRDQWLSLAREYEVAIAGSYMRPLPSARPENVMLVCGPSGGVLAEYAKIHLFTPGGEDRKFSPGSSPVTFEYRGIRFGCAICFDLRFPELFREYLHLGCSCVLVQGVWPAGRVSDWELLLRARALENRMYVAGAGCLGFEEISGTDYSGRSMFCDPEGRVVSDAGVFAGECWCDIDADVVRSWRTRWMMI